MMKLISAILAASLLALGGALAAEGESSNPATLSANAPPSITTQPLAAQILNAGSVASLSVSASGTAVTYQWYQGARGDTSNPVGGNSSSYTTPSLATNSSYWVRVSNADGSVDSAESVIVVWTQGIRIGDQFSANLSPLASGGKTLKLVGKLPTGLRLNTKTWQISGLVSGKNGNFTPSIQVIQNKAVLQTISIPISVGNFPTSLLGNYEALLKDQNGAPFGVFKLTTGKNVWTASLETLGQAKRTAKGSFVLQQGAESVSIEAKFAATKTAPAVALNFTLDGGSPTFLGTYGAGTIEGFKMIDSLAAATKPILYNLILDQGIVDALDKPAGKGWASGSFTKTGIGVFKGMLGDATSCRFSLRLSTTGQAILWAQPYANKNSFIGGVVDLAEMVPNATIDEALESKVSWVKVADSKTLCYPSGFSFENLSVSGSRWIVPATHTALGNSLGWLGGEKCTVRIYGAGLSNESLQSAVPVKFPKEFTLNKTFKLLAPVNTSTLIWGGSIVKGTGAFSGSFALPAGFAANTIAGSGAVSGLLLQDEKWGITTGLGLMKVPTSATKGSFRTAALTLEQYEENNAPAITGVADQIIAISSSTEPIPFTINDAHTSASSLKLSGSSSNTTLVPNANIVFGGSGANRTVTVMPASNQSGTATITVTVSDGWLSTSNTFVLTVNSAPTISDITDQVINTGGSTAAIDFTISDSQTAAVSGSSSNTTLVPNSNIVFGGSGGNRTVTVTPASNQSGTATITVTVSDGSLSASDTFLLAVYSPPPTGFALIPQGSFTMESLRTVTLDAFYMAKYEVTEAEWDKVLTWALSNGYSDLAALYGKDLNHPVIFVSWYDILKWCNARSQMEGLTPVYYTDDAQTTIYKTGDVNVTNTQVKWSANGYRLPTEAEWEKAARGGLSGKRFPWGDTISHSEANYNADDYVSTYHPTYAVGRFPYTSPVGAFAANGYGLYDMAGNVAELCWDRFGDYAAGNQTNPRGPTSGLYRVVRGGSWNWSANSCKVADRYYYRQPSYVDNNLGFRVLRNADSINGNLAPTIWAIADQSITAGSNTDAVTFKVGDAQTAAGSLVVSGSSSNTALVPNANIVFGGSGADRTVMVTPASGQIGTASITVTVSDGSLSASNTFLLTVNRPSPTGFALVPGGSFTMGDSYNINASFQGGYEPTRWVILDAFYMGKYEVSKAEWDEVRTWALSNGYTDLATGSGKASTHPVHSISWYDVVKWCNARSQLEGLTPVYYTNDVQTTVYKTGNVKVTNAQVKWSANGYRLPTEAEWEKAARGGLGGKRFPWGNTISHSQANYLAYSAHAYDVYDRPEDLSSSGSSVNNFHPTYIYPTYETESWPYTSPVGEFAPNGYGLYDMVGNVSEWCWDWDGEYATGSQTNPRGAISGTHRVHRGGSWITYAPECRIYNRPVGDPTGASYVIGFRVLRSSAP